MNKYYFSLVFFLSALSFAESGNSIWHILGANKDGDQVKVDTNSIVSKNNNLTAKTITNLNKETKRAKSLVVSVQIDCSNNTATILQFTVFDRPDGQGNLISSQNFKENEMAGLIDEGTDASLLKNYICKK